MNIYDERLGTSSLSSSAPVSFASLSALFNHS